MNLEGLHDLHTNIFIEYHYMEIAITDPQSRLRGYFNIINEYPIIYKNFLKNDDL